MIDPEKQKKLREIADNLTRELADRGQIIEGGWRALELLTGLADNGDPEQRKFCRRCYFFGAQHLFASIMSVMEPGEEPTEADCDRFDKIDRELRAFVESVKAAAAAQPVKIL